MKNEISKGNGRKREKELGRPFSIWQSNPKYNTEYRMKRIEEMIRRRTMTIEDKRRISIFGSLSNYYKWAKEWDLVRASLKCTGKDLSKINIVYGGKNDGRDEEN